ncbi:MAG TPA: hypothetical protein VGP70_02780 [Actinomadura sp.]|jgi:hypothetical protein|nr:hypothetical protein [Actinomadura sp.]
MSAPWDEDYKRDVLEPAREAGDQPPEDLLLRYRLAEPLSPGEIPAQVKRVRQCWRRARGQLKYRKLIDRLEADHRELAPLFTAAERGDLGPLRARLRGGAERAAHRRTEAKARLVDAAGPLRMLGPRELEGIARSGGVSRAELESLVRAERIEVREPDPLPASAPYQGYVKARESLAVLGHRHLADFLFGDRMEGPMRVLGGFHAPGVRLDASIVTAVSEQWARRPRDTTSTNAGTILVALRSALGEPAPHGGGNAGGNGGGEGDRLAGLLLYDLVDRLRERRRERASERALLRYAVDALGVEPGDARRLVFSVVRESGPAGGLAGRLRELLDAGAVHAAALLADAASPERDPGPAGAHRRPAGPGSESESAEILAAEARQRVAAATRLRDEAVRCGDPDQAWRLLADALHLVGDLPGAEEHLRRLPPRPAAAPVAVPTGDGVRISWTASPSMVGEIGYRVLRRAGRPPRDGADGVPVPSGGTTALDANPPVNAPLFYAVIAVRGDAAAPPAATGMVCVRPEPSGVELTAGDGVVTGRWRCPPAAARVAVTRVAAASVTGARGAVTGGEPGAAVGADRQGFRDAVRNGTTYHYHVAAVYIDENGREVTTPGVWVSATASARPEPVGELRVEPHPGEPGRVLVAFAPPRHGTVELVLLGSPPRWPYGAVVPLADVRDAGHVLPATPIEHGLSVRPRASGVLLAVTVSEDAAAIGAHRRHVDLPPPRRLAAQRRGGAIHVGFDWPGEVPEVEVTYQIGASDPCRILTTRAAYEAQGGVRLAAPEGEQVDVLVASSGISGDARVVGAPVAATVPGHRVVGYDLRAGGPPWHRTVVLTLRAGEPVRIPRLVLVLRAGEVMPRREEDGETLASWEEVDVPAVLSVPRPRRTGPFWLRCFTGDGGIELSDPPVRRLRIKR